MGFFLIATSMYIRQHELGNVDNYHATILCLDVFVVRSDTTTDLDGRRRLRGHTPAVRTVRGQLARGSFDGRTVLAKTQRPLAKSFIQRK